MTTSLGIASRRKRRNMATVARLVVLIVFLVIVLVPIVVVLFDAFNTNAALESTALGSFQHLTVSNFTYVIDDTNVLIYLRNSLIVSLTATVASIVLGALAGYAMSRYDAWWLRTYSLSLFFLQTFPLILVLIPLFDIFRMLHLINTFGSVILVYIVEALPFASWMFRAYFDRFPRSLEESAWIDGASRLRTLVRIVAPNSWPAAVSVGLYSFLLAWGDYLVAYVFLTSTNVLTLPVGLEAFFQQNTTQWAPVMASAAIMMVPGVVIFGVLQRYYNLAGFSGAVVG